MTPVRENSNSKLLVGYAADVGHNGSNIHSNQRKLGLSSSFQVDWIVQQVASDNYKQALFHRQNVADQVQAVPSLGHIVYRIEFRGGEINTEIVFLGCKGCEMQWQDRYNYIPHSEVSRRTCFDGEWA